MSRRSYCFEELTTGDGLMNGICNKCFKTYHQPMKDAVDDLMLSIAARAYTAEEKLKQIEHKIKLRAKHCEWMATRGLYKNDHKESSYWWYKRTEVFIILDIIRKIKGGDAEQNTGRILSRKTKENR